MDPGLKGCSYLLGKVPSWMSLTEREKMEWLNRLLSELWPYFDRGICNLVKEAVEPIMESLRPPGIIKRIFFQEFTFGTAPFRVEGISVKEDPSAIDMELDVRWSGDANITLGIDLPAGGEFTRLTPKVTDIVFVATLKVIMKPLVDEIPGFAGVAVALKSPPTIKYRLNFGALSGGSVTTAPIVAFINFIVKEVIVGMLLWPKRLTVPILGTGGVLTDIMNHPPMPDVDLEVERLNGRQQGVIKVTVLSARELKAYDSLTGKSDPFVELFTTPDHRCRTKVVKRSLAPVWSETFYLPVLEKDQVKRKETFFFSAAAPPASFFAHESFAPKTTPTIQNNNNNNNNRSSAASCSTTTTSTWPPRPTAASRSGRPPEKCWTRASSWAAPPCPSRPLSTRKA